MNYRTCFALMMIAAPPLLAEPAEAQNKPMKAHYMIYSGDLGDAWTPTKTDRKLSIDVTGQPAKDIFESLYPDIQAECAVEKGERQRRKGHIWCIYQPSSGYTCYFGFDLRTGKSIDGGEC
jgi:hypothetical protein